jgi:hypothetical protein
LLVEASPIAITIAVAVAVAVSWIVIVAIVLVTFTISCIIVVAIVLVAITICDERSELRVAKRIGMRGEFFLQCLWELTTLALGTKAAV